MWKTCASARGLASFWRFAAGPYARPCRAAVRGRAFSQLLFLFDDGWTSLLSHRLSTAQCSRNPGLAKQQRSPTHHCQPPQWFHNKDGEDFESIFFYSNAATSALGLWRSTEERGKRERDWRQRL